MVYEQCNTCINITSWMKNVIIFKELNYGINSLIRNFIINRQNVKPSRYNQVALISNGTTMKQWFVIFKIDKISFLYSVRQDLSTIFIIIFSWIVSSTLEVNYNKDNEIVLSTFYTMFIIIIVKTNYIYSEEYTFNNTNTEYRIILKISLSHSWI